MPGVEPPIEGGKEGLAHGRTIAFVAAQQLRPARWRRTCLQNAKVPAATAGHRHEHADIVSARIELKFVARDAWLADLKLDLAPGKSVTNADRRLISAAKGQVLSERARAARKMVLLFPPRPIVCRISVDRLVRPAVFFEVGLRIAGEIDFADL